MSTSDNGKPPICLPPFVGDRPPLGPPLEHAPRQGDGGASSRPVSAGGAAATAVHWAFLVLAVVVLSAAFSLEVRHGETVVVPGINAALPNTCTFRTVTGRPCPGCGLT
ncbi:MAG: DUF2752 domain-containing protein, partial [Planctomycetota bacterium]